MRREYQVNLPRRDIDLAQVPESGGSSGRRMNATVHDHPLIVTSMDNDGLAEARPKDGNLDLVSGGRGKCLKGNFFD